MSLLIAMTGFADEWTLVTNPAELQAGDQIVLGCYTKGKTASTTISGSQTKYLEGITSTFSGSQLVSMNESTAVFTLSGNASAWTLTNQNGQVLGATAAKKLAWNNPNATNTWTITENGIQSTNSSFGTIQYNEQGSSRFTVYTSSQTPVQVYRKGSAVPQVTIHYQGFPYRKTHCDDPVFKAGTEYTISSFIPVVNGKRFVAWNFEGEEYAPGATITVPEKDVLFIPVWHDETGISNNESLVNATKQIRNGQLIIVRDGVEYDVMGVKLQ